MMQFSSRKNRNRPFYVQIARSLGLVLVFAAIAILFWKHYERSIREIHSRQAVWDQTGTLSSSQRNAVLNYVGKFEQRYGITLEVKVAEEELYFKTDPRTLFIGLIPSENRSVVILPPLLERALDPDVVRYIQEEHFQHYLDEEGDWVEGLDACLSLIWERMRNMEEK